MGVGARPKLGPRIVVTAARAAPRGVYLLLLLLLLLAGRRRERRWRQHRTALALCRWLRRLLLAQVILIRGSMLKLGPGGCRTCCTRASSGPSLGDLSQGRLLSFIDPAEARLETALSSRQHVQKAAGSSSRKLLNSSPTCGTGFGVERSKPGPSASSSQAWGLDSAPLELVINGFHTCGAGVERVEPGGGASSSISPRRVLMTCSRMRILASFSSHFSLRRKPSRADPCACICKPNVR